MYVENQEKREDGSKFEVVGEVPIGELLLISITAVVVVVAMVFLIEFTGFLQEEARAGVTFSVDSVERSVRVTAVTMGNSNAIVIRGFENYPTEGEGEPVLFEAGDSVTFKFNRSGTEDLGTLAAVAVRGTVTESDDRPRYGEEISLSVVDDGARQTVIQKRSYKFRKGRNTR